MSTFELYFNTGMSHILDINGMDHIVFIIILCAIYLARDWKNLLILVTAFTIGHSITLALVTFQVIHVNSSLVEFLIPLTILITAMFNIIFGKRSNSLNISYLIALFFGLIHGMGFSNYLRSLLGKGESVVMQLLAFNLGLEVGQIIIVLAFLLISFIMVDIFNVSRKDWRLVISSMGAGIALYLLIENKFW